MSAVPAPLPPAAASALSAFLRGVERRAAVVAALQHGSSGEAGLQAVAAAMRAFAARAADVPMAEWPQRFWSRLAAVPAGQAGGQWSQELTHLGLLGPVDRLALLLRIGAGLDEEQAAAVVGADLDAYRMALTRACPVDAAGKPDAGAWRMLAEEVQRQVRDLPPALLARLATVRESVFAPPSAEPAKAPPPARPAAPRRSARGPVMGRRALWVAVPVLLALIAAVLWWRGAGQGPALGDPPPPPREGAVSEVGPVLVEELADSSMPAAASVDLHPADAAMLRDPDLALVPEADFHAWFAAGGPLPVDESNTQPSRPEPAAAGLETVDADE